MGPGAVYVEGGETEQQCTSATSNKYWGDQSGAYVVPLRHVPSEGLARRNSNVGFVVLEAA